MRRIHATPEVARWWDAPGESFPWDEPESTRLTILVDGAIAGLIQFHEELEPKYRHAGIDLFLGSHPARSRPGHGDRATARTPSDRLPRSSPHRDRPRNGERGGDSPYAKVGFKPVGVLRRAERDPDGQGWHDALLMELLAEDSR